MGRLVRRWVQVELAKACGVGEQIDLHDLVMGDREAEYRKRSALTNHDDARRTVDQRPTAVGREPRVGGGPLGHRPRASDLPGRAREGGAWVDPEDDVRIEHSDERL